MSEFKGTPGPWEYCEDDNVITGRGINPLIEIVPQSNPVGIEVRNANARLIAAAPELLAACESYLEYRQGEDICIDDIAKQMKTAVAKALGK